MAHQKLTDKDKDDIRRKFIYRYNQLGQRPSVIVDGLSKEYNVAPITIHREVTVTDAKRAAATAKTNQTAVV